MRIGTPEEEVQLMRFLGPTLARQAIVIAEQMTNVRLAIEHRPVPESDTRRGVGAWTISAYPTRSLSYAEKARLEDLVKVAITLVLADTIADAARGFHIANDIWLLRKENRKQVIANHRACGVLENA